MVLKARRWWKKDTNSSYCQQDLSEPKSLAHSDLKDCKSSSSSSSTSARVTTSTRFCVGIFTHFFLGLHTWVDNQLFQSHGKVSGSHFRLSFLSTKTSTIGWLLCAFSLGALLGMVPFKNSTAPIFFPIFFEMERQALSMASVGEVWCAFGNVC